MTDYINETYLRKETTVLSKTNPGKIITELGQFSLLSVDLIRKGKTSLYLPVKIANRVSLTFKGITDPVKTF